MSELIKDIWLYFAKFPLHEGVMKNFRSTNSKTPGYSDFKTEVENLAVNSLIPELKNYLLSVNTPAILEYVKNVDSRFLFVEYGDLNTNENAYKAKDIDFALNIYIASPFSYKQFDFVDETLIMQQNLLYLQQMLEIMETDSNESCSFKKMLDFPVQITPIEPINFYENIGWSARFTSKRNDLLIEY